MIVTVVQPQLFWKDPVANRANIEEMLWQLDGATDLILLPETFNTGFATDSPDMAEPFNGPTMQWMKQIGKQFNSAIAGSLFIKTAEGIFNQFVLIDKSGEVYTYNKRHLFGNEKSMLQHGEELTSCTLAPFQIGLSTCYDLRFPAWCRKVSEGKDLMLFVANWPASRIHHWKSLLTARAIENQCYVIGCNITGGELGEIKYNGGSMVVGYDGTILAEAKEEAGLLTFTLDHTSLVEYRDKYPFLNDKDDFKLDM